MMFRYAVYFFAVALAVTPSLVVSQTPQELQNQISVHSAQIEALNKEIAAFEKQLQEVGAKKQTLQNTVATLDLQRKQLSAKINVTKNNIATTELEIKRLDGSIGDKETAIEKDEMGLAQAIQSLDQAETGSLIEHVLNNDSVAEFWDAVESNQVFQSAVNEHIGSLQLIKQELTVSRDESDKKRVELEKQRQTLASQQGSLDVTRREQNSLLAQTKSQEANYQTLLETKRAAKQAFEQALNELESKLQYTLDPSHIPSAGKGILRWPLDSVHVTQYFGNTEFARSGAYSGKGHNGVDFRAAVGTPVKAALSGTVIGSGNSDSVKGCYSYGRWLLIKHGNGISTLYAHLSQANVSQGQQVTTGQVIGYSGNTGYATGPHLHFSVYASDAVQVRQLGTNTPCGKAVIPVSALGGYLNPMDYL
ncbi:peptidoglycan DD-metalloendopeptidase family protein [Candidatus Kaiserbacteria bacterium]|nr:peptidoglycan DD-metalloendopeptidase family protein [Candidatus Kaiserbacteria bacterium]